VRTPSLAELNELANELERCLRSLADDYSAAAQADELSRVR
jgi:hypothetical protein